MRNRFAIVIAVGLIGVALVATVAARAVRAHETGWTGLRYQPAQDQEALKRVGVPAMLARSSGVVDSVLDGSPADRAGLRVRDQVKSVNGIPIEKLPLLSKLADRTRRGDEIVYEIVRGKRTFTAKVRTVSPFASPVVIAGIAVNTFIALAYLAIAVLVFWHKPSSRRARVFLWLCVVSSISFLASSYVELEMTAYEGLQPLFTRFDSLALCIILGLAGLATSALLLHLSLVFPKELPVLGRHPALIHWVYTLIALPLVLAVNYFWFSSWNRPALAAGVPIAAAAALVLILRRVVRTWQKKLFSYVLDHPFLVQGAVVMLTFFIVATAVPRFSRSALFAAAILGTLAFMLVLFAIFLAYPVMTLVSLIAGYRSSSVEEKRQVRWPMWGTGIAVGVTILTMVVVIGIIPFADQINSTALAMATAFGRLIYLLIPISFAFGILKHRLMDIDVIIKKTVVYSAVTGVIVAAFFVLVAGVGTLITSFLQIRSQTVTVISTLVLALAFVPLRNRVQRFVDRRFFQRKYEASEAEKLIQQEVLEATELKPVLRKIAEYVQQVLQTRSVVIFTPDDNARFVPSGSIGVADEVLRGFNFERDAVARIDRTAPASTLRLAQDDWARVKKMNAELLVPAARRGELRGVMVIGSMLSGSFDEDDHAFLEFVAHQVAFAVDNLTVGDEVRDYERALEIQRSLLPRSIPQLDGVEIDAEWKPARIVGGDYFDVLQLGPTTLGLCIADVAGKGMPAALLMANLQAAVKASASDQLSPSEVCSKVRNVVCGTLSGGRFVTFFYAMLDTNRMLLRYVNAGHNPSLLLKADGSEIRLDAGGPAFARLMQSGVYTTSEEQLGEGDTLVLFTDGVTEARSTADEEFGEERLTNVVRNAAPSARAVVRSIADNVRTFSDGIAHDDVTIVCMRVTRGAIENVVPFPRAAG